MKKSNLSRSLVSTEHVIGVKVQNPQSENLGEIEEIILEKVSGKVRYLVLSFGGFLGMGDKLFALPWNAIHYNPEQDAFILNISKEKLKNAPGFNKDQPPDYNDQIWGESISKYYDTKPFWLE